MRRQLYLVTGVCTCFLVWLVCSRSRRDTINRAGRNGQNGMEEDVAKRFTTLPQDHPDIIRYILENGYIRPPSEEEYNLEKPNVDPSMGQSEFVLKKLLNNMRNGFFIECGALDGETRSNTLFMEKELGWKGLLIEGGPANYELVLKKHRKAWTAGACLAVKPYPHKVEYEENFNIGKIKDVIENSDEDYADPAVKLVKMQCFPLYSLLAAINVTTVDYFSLDVEGHELQVLKTIPFDKVFIKTLSVEYSHTEEGKEELLQFMGAQGYVSAGEVIRPRRRANDIMFIHKSLWTEEMME